MKLAVLTCLIGMGLTCTNVSGQELKPTVEMTVKVKVKESKFLDLIPHALGFYVRKGSTTVDLKADRQSYHFKLGEDLSLFGVHRVGSKLYLVFRAEYEPGRGYLAYQANEKGGFDAIAITALPAAAATPNCGSFKKERELLRAAHSIDELLDTSTIRLWSQMATGKSSLSWGLNKAAAQKIWQTTEWRPSLQENVNEVK